MYQSFGPNNADPMTSGPTMGTASQGAQQIDKSAIDLAVQQVTGSIETTTCLLRDLGGLIQRLNEKLVPVTNKGRLEGMAKEHSERVQKTGQGTCAPRAVGCPLAERLEFLATSESTATELVRNYLTALEIQLQSLEI